MDGGGPSDGERVPGDLDPARWFRSGLGERRDAHAAVEAEYHSALVRSLRAGGPPPARGRSPAGSVEIRLPRELGFCYGVERAVDYAYEAVRHFPDRRVVLTGEIIHNPEVNARLRAAGVRFVGDPEVPHLDALRADDVVVLPAFGVPVGDLERIRELGAVVVDTTCGSVLNVWKNVERYAREGRTTVVHGKAAHEETRATVSRLLRFPGSRYVVVRDLAEAGRLAAAIRTPPVSERESDAFREQFRGRCSEDFDPRRDLERIGMANQTTMLSGESLEIADLLAGVLQERHGREALEERFRAFDTICSATQDRQDALRELLREPLDLVLVVGGFNSSNTGHLLEIARRVVPAWHVEGAADLESRERIRHKPAGAAPRAEAVRSGWLRRGVRRVGLTSGASTPDRVLGEVIERVLALAEEGLVDAAS
jgi:4-hydroxy-3-methylbut-2-enyl diphosphate reductase